MNTTPTTPPPEASTAPDKDGKGVVSAATGSALRVIFLDIDGVLSCFGSRGLCATRLDLFAEIVKQTGAEVVLSSTWRHPHCRDQRMRLQQELGKREVEFFGMTPILNLPIGASSLVNGVQRGQEINAWLDAAHRRHEISAFIILDDDPNDEMGDLKHALVKCDGYQGLTPEIAAEVVRRLNADGEARAESGTSPKPSDPLTTKKL